MPSRRGSRSGSPANSGRRRRSSCGPPTSSRPWSSKAPLSAADPTRHSGVVPCSIPRRRTGSTASTPGRSRPKEMWTAGREIYLSLPNGTGRAKLPPALGRRLRTPPRCATGETVTNLVTGRRLSWLGSVLDAATRRGQQSQKEGDGDGDDDGDRRGELPGLSTSGRGGDLGERGVGVGAFHQSSEDMLVLPLRLFSTWPRPGIPKSCSTISADVTTVPSARASPVT